MRILGKKFLQNFRIRLKLENEVRYPLVGSVGLAGDRFLYSAFKSRDTEGPAHEPRPPPLQGSVTWSLWVLLPACLVPCSLSAPIPWVSLKGSPAAFLNYVHQHGHAESGRSGTCCSRSC